MRDLQFYYEKIQRPALGVQSRGEVGWIEVESIRLFRPDPADMFVGREAFEGLEALGNIVGVQEAGEVSFELVAGLVVVASDRRLLDRAVHAFDLAVSPGMVRLGQAVFDAVLAAAH